MRIEKRSYSVLIVSGSDKSLDFISNSLPMELFYPTVSLNSAAEARRLLVNQDFDIVIINTPLKDDIGIELALEIAEKDFTAVMIIVKNEMFDQVAYRVEDYGVFVELMPNLAGLAEPKDNVFPSQNASVYIKSIIPEKMKIKLIIIDSFDNDNKKADEKYFFEGEHIDNWQYSPEQSEKVIKSVF